MGRSAALRARAPAQADAGFSTLSPASNSDPFAGLRDGTRRA